MMLVVERAGMRGLLALKSCIKQMCTEWQ